MNNPVVEASIVIKVPNLGLFRLPIITAFLSPLLLLSCRGTEDIPEAWNLPSGFAERVRGIRALSLPPAVTNFDWLPDSLESLEASGSAATVIWSLPRHLKSLDLSYSEVHSLSKLPEGLKELDLRFTNLKQIPDLPSGITHLKLGGDAISSYQGIPVGLRELVVEEAPQLTVLYGLPRGLESLTLIGTSFKDLRGLPPNLQSLTLKWTNVKVLSELPRSVRTLVLDGNHLLSAGESLPPFLTSLTIRGTPVPDLVPLNYLTELEIDNWNEQNQKLPRTLQILRLNGVAIPFDVRELDSLRILSVYGVNLTDIARLPVGIEWLKLGYCSFPSQQLILSDLKSLRNLDLGWSGLAMLPVLPEALVSLDLSATGIENIKRDVDAFLPSGGKVVNAANVADMTGLLPSLSGLTFRRLLASEVKGLPVSLEELDLADSPELKHIGGTLSKLRRLNMHGTSIAKLSDLPKGIRVLDISDTALSSLQGVPPDLEELVVSDGQLKDLAGWPAHLHTLRFLRPIEPEKIRLEDSPLP